MKTITLLDAEYSGESIIDAARDLSESLDSHFTPEAANITCDKYGIPTGKFKLTLVWVDE